MSHRGFSHIGLTTLDLDKTRDFYEGVLGFKEVVSDEITVKEGGRIRHVFFDVGHHQLIAFMEPNEVVNVPESFDTGINHGLGVPASFYHFAFEAGSEGALASRHKELRERGVDVTDIVDHDWAKSFYFRDPNGVSLEYCCMMRELTQEDATMRVLAGVPRALLDIGNEALGELGEIRANRSRRRG